MSVRIMIAIGIAGLLMVGAAGLLPGGSNQISAQLSEPEHVSLGAPSPKVFLGRVSALQRIHELQREELRAAVGYLQELVEWALVLREQTLAFARVAEEQRAHGLPLSGVHLERIREGTLQHLGLHHQMIALVEKYASWSFLSDSKLPLIEEDLRVKATMLSLAGALVLYDNVALSVILYSEDRDLRRLINRPDSGFALESDQMLRILEDYREPSYRSRVRRAATALDERRAWIERAKRDDPQIAYLDALIAQSPSSQKIRTGSAWGEYASVLGLFSVRGIDQLDRASLEGLNLISKLFGNTVGLVQMRRGKLSERPEITATLVAHLEPLDILLDSAPFRLTDKFIPGHYGHVALWVGTPQEIQALGLWEHPLIIPHRTDILRGASIVEALRSGVQLSRVDDFLDVDDVAVLRRGHLTDDQRRQSVLRAFRQLGKAYDFNFDVETTDRIVCSELIYLTFGDLEWPTETVLRRPTISPDHVAQMALANGPLSLELLYHDGTRIDQSTLELFEKLLQAH